MASTGNTYPTVGEAGTRSGASTAWTNPGNIVSDNTTDATCSSGTNGSHYLVARAFGFNITADSVINGITIRVEASEHTSGTEALYVQLQDDTGVLIGSSKSQTINGTTKAVYTYGATNDVWSAALTTAIVNDADFGCKIWFQTTHDIRIDYVTLAVEYTEPKLGTTDVATQVVYLNTGTGSKIQTTALTGVAPPQFGAVDGRKGSTTGLTGSVFAFGASTASPMLGSDLSGSVIFRGANLANKLRSDLVQFSRPSLLRGVPQRLYGVFTRAVPTTNLATQVSFRGTNTSEKFGGTALASTLTLNFTSTTGAPLGAASLQGIVITLGAETYAKTGTGAATPSFGARSTTTAAATKIAGQTGRTSAVRGSTTASPRRTVVTFTRLGLMRGISQARYGSFSRANVHEATATGFQPHGASVQGSKIAPATLASILGYRAENTSTKIGSTGLVSKFIERSSGTHAKTGVADLVGSVGRTATETWQKQAQGEGTGISIVRGTITIGTPHRDVVRFTSFSLYMLPERVEGSFARIPGFFLTGFMPLSVGTSSTAAKTFGISLSTQPNPLLGQSTGSKIVEEDLEGQVLLTGGQSTHAKTGVVELATSIGIFGATTSQFKTGPTYDLKGAFILSAVTSETKIGSAAGAGKFPIQTQTTADKIASTTALQGRVPLFGSIGSSPGPKTNLIARLVVVADMTSMPAPKTDLRSRFVFTSAIDTIQIRGFFLRAPLIWTTACTAEKAVAETSIQSRLVLRSVVSREKKSTTEVSAKFQSPRGAIRSSKHGKRVRLPRGGSLLGDRGLQHQQTTRSSRQTTRRK